MHLFLLLGEQIQLLLIFCELSFPRNTKVWHLTFPFWWNIGSELTWRVKSNSDMSDREIERGKSPDFKSTAWHRLAFLMKMILSRTPEFHDYLTVLGWILNFDRILNIFGIWKYTEYWIPNIFGFWKRTEFEYRIVLFGPNYSNSSNSERIIWSATLPHFKYFFHFGFMIN